MTATLTIAADDTMTLDGQPVTADRVVSVFASTEGTEPDVLVMEGPEGFGGAEVASTVLPLDACGDPDLDAAQAFVEGLGYELVHVVHEGRIPQPGIWTAADGETHVATAIRP